MEITLFGDSTEEDVVISFPRRSGKMHSFRVKKKKSRVNRKPTHWPLKPLGMKEALLVIVYANIVGAQEDFLL